MEQRMEIRLDLKNKKKFFVIKKIIYRETWSRRDQLEGRDS